MRISKYFDQVFIDEVQDFAGNDFNFLTTLSASQTEQLYVGDFFQHTYDTSRDGNVNGNLHDNLDRYISRFCALGLSPDGLTLNKSHRCNPEICEFIQHNLGISMESHRSGGTVISVITASEQTDFIFRDPSIIKLFYQAHYHYDCFSKNWGESKGEDRYDNVCVVLNNKTWEFLINGNLKQLPPQTKSKLYVAITRTKGNLYFLQKKLLKQYKRST